METGVVSSRKGPILLIEIQLGGGDVTPQMRGVKPVGRATVAKGGREVLIGAFVSLRRTGI